jgi:predicted kinase
MKAYITIGLPASGKTTWAKDFVEKNSTDSNNIVRVNNDDIRAAIYADSGNYDWSPKVEREVRVIREDLIKERASVRADIVIDNTHLNPKTLEQIKSFCKSEGYVIEIVDFRHVSLEECIRRDSLREGPSKVGEKVIRDMYTKFMSDSLDRNVPEWNPNSLPDCIIVDIDGTLAKMKDRGPYEEHKVYQDDVRKHVLFTIASMMTANPELKVFVFSGRSEACLGETIIWINEKCDLVVDNYLNWNFKNDCVPDYSVELHMRKVGDKRRDSLVKMDLYNEYVKDKYNTIVVFDDRPQVIRECWKALNLPVFQCGLIDVEF